MVSVREGSQIRFSQLEVEMDFPLTMVPADQRLSHWPMLLTIFLMVGSLPWHKVSTYWSQSQFQNTYFWPNMLGWTLLSPLLLCLLSGILAAICGHVRLHVSLLAEKIYGKWGAALVHLLLIVAAFAVVNQTISSLTDSVMHMTNIPSNYQLVVVGFFVCLFALPAYFGATTFIAISMLWLPATIVMLTWLLNNEFTQNPIAHLAGAAPFDLTSWLSFQHDIVMQLLVFAFFAANMARFSENAHEGARAGFFGLWVPTVLFVSIGLLLQLAVGEASLLALFRSVHGVYVALGIATVGSMLIAQQGFYTATLSACSLFGTQYRGRWLYILAVLIGGGIVYSYWVNPIDITSWLNCLLSPLLSSLIVSFLLVKEKVNTKEVVPAVRWLLFLPLLVAVGANCVLPFDLFVQGLVLGAVCPLFFYVFRKHEAKDPLHRIIRK